MKQWTARYGNKAAGAFEIAVALKGALADEDLEPEQLDLLAQVQHTLVSGAMDAPMALEFLDALAYANVHAWDVAAALERYAEFEGESDGVVYAAEDAGDDPDSKPPEEASEGGLRPAPAASRVPREAPRPAA